MKFEKIKGPQNHHLFRPFDLNGQLRETIWVKFSRVGRGRLEESLKTTVLGEARELRDKRIAEFLGEKPRKSSKVFLVEDKYPEFVELHKIKSKGTYEGIESMWRVHLGPYFGGMILDEVNETEWLKYVASKREAGSDIKFFNHRKYLSMFLHWLHRDGLIQRLPRLPDVDPEIAEGKVYSDEQIQALLDNADFDLKLQIQCAVTMGMRVGEILSLEWWQVDFEKKTIYLPAEKTKIRKERSFGISPICLDLLKDLKSRSIGTAVFASPTDPNKTRVKGGNKRSWASCKRKAGISKEYRFHWLRHTFLTRAFKQAVNPALICHYAGLSLDEAQKTYLHFSVEDTRAVASLVRPSI